VWKVVKYSFMRCCVRILYQSVAGISYKDLSNAPFFDRLNAVYFASPWEVLLNFYLTASIKFRLNAMQ
jgi:hypothetical protein